MKDYSIQKYEKEDYENWNSFVSNAKNATFLFHRDFMEYHSDRYEGHSLIITVRQVWVAVLPANRVGDILFSHQGLTYGGLIYNDKLKLASVLLIFKSILQYLQSNNIQQLQIKFIPTIYHQKPSDELLYGIFLAEATLIKRDSLSVIDLREKINFSKDRIAGYKKGIKANLKIVEETDFENFWNLILIPNMLKKHKTLPTHSLEEIIRLHKLFPKNIRQFNVYQNNTIVAGTTIFESQAVAHAQYIFGDDSKSTNGSLDFLYHYLISNVFCNKKYIDFGSSNGYLGDKLNVNLSYWKQSFGASTIVQNFYSIETGNHTKIIL